MELLKKIFARINATWRRAQEDSMHEEYKLLAETWDTEYRAHTWSKFKNNNARVNQYLQRTA